MPARNSSVGASTWEGSEKRANWASRPTGSTNPWVLATRLSTNLQGNQLNHINEPFAWGKTTYKRSRYSFCQCLLTVLISFCFYSSTLIICFGNASLYKVLVKSMYNQSANTEPIVICTVLSTVAMQDLPIASAKATIQLRILGLFAGSTPNHYFGRCSIGM